MQRNRDRELVSFSVLATVGPPLISGIFTLAQQIHKTVETCGENDIDCIELDGHIYEVIDCLEYIESDAPRLFKQLEQPIINLDACLVDCLELVQKYTNASAIGLFLRSHSYKRKFDKMNDQLEKCKQRLSFAIQVHSLSVTKKRSQFTTRITTQTLGLDGRHKRTHADQSKHRPMTPLVNHAVKQSPKIGHHQSRHLHHSNSPHHQQRPRVSSLPRTPNIPRVSSVPRSLMNGVHHH
ncbi:unnamed protein product [Adineta steineri]|uniref:Mixed lineage kinase domain-containing protein n=1 Tax=Adineta steineri TaxID=433720 RepID=A0A819NCM2_9BILA|nr:unnamed protein product [Adineta steineri]CAF3993621.1 unnamed protein product [Adineta steineri]